ncbi:MAG TPA: anti-sigma factor [Myxococcota bacterium]|nr:anti-sigma factor [Myxococcota bacterium]
MSCEERAEEILEYAADALEAGEREAVARHLATGCPRCAGALAEAESVLAHLTLSLAPLDPSPAVRARLLAKLEGVLPATPSALPAPRPAGGAAVTQAAEAWGGAGSWRAGISAAIAAGLAALVTYFGIAHPLVRQIDALRTEREALSTRETALERSLAERDQRIARLESEAARSTETVRMLRSPDVEVVPLRGAAPQPGAAGRLFFDPAGGRWYFHASQLRPAGPGKTYELWFINRAQQKIPAATFDVDTHGEATLLVDVPESAGALGLAAVTDEPAGGVKQPTGEIQLLGELTTPKS